MKKYDVINRIIKEKKYKTYLEIGYGNGENFKEIKVKDKLAVEPGKRKIQPGDKVVLKESDAFFETNEKEFDLIFIDGLHHADQVWRDMVNAMKFLSKDGCIILHDINPATKEIQEVPMRSAIWTGDCWRAWYGFINKYPKVITEFYKDDHGIGVIFPEGKKYYANFVDTETTFEQYREYVDSL